jgi:hypothetical protein
MRGALGMAEIFLGRSKKEITLYSPVRRCNLQCLLSKHVRMTASTPSEMFGNKSDMTGIAWKNEFRGCFISFRLFRRSFIKHLSYHLHGMSVKLVNYSEERRKDDSNRRKNLFTHALHGVILLTEGESPSAPSTQTTTGSIVRPLILLGSLKEPLTTMLTSELSTQRHSFYLLRKNKQSRGPVG